MCFFFLFSFFRLQAGNSLTHTQLFFFTFFSHFRDELEARRNKIVRKIIIRTQGSLYAKGWQTWVHVALKMKKYDQIIRRVAAKMKFRAATQCLTAWRQYCSTEKKQRRIVTAALHRIKNRVIISAFVEWKTTIARVVRNRRVVAKNLLRRAKLHVAAHWKVQGDRRRRVRKEEAAAAVAVAATGLVVVTWHGATARFCVVLLRQDIVVVRWIFGGNF